MALVQTGCFNAAEGPLTRPMSYSDATGLPLLKSGPFGADLIRFPAGGKVGKHTHPGEHMLFVLSGGGRLEYQDTEVNLIPGLCYHVPSNVPHAIYATTELTLISVANDHRPVDSEERLSVDPESKAHAARSRMLERTRSGGQVALRATRREDRAGD